MSTDVPDVIRKQIQLKATPARVWRALTTAAEFGAWFRAELEGEFAVGEVIRGRITYPGYENLTFEMEVEGMEPERRFVLRWHPGDDPSIASTEPQTRVEFLLEPSEGGTLLTVVETGFSRISAARRGEAFRKNEDGWEMQMEHIRSHVDG